MQRAPSHPLPEILNVVIGADKFIQYLGVLEADLERIYSTTPLEHRDRVRKALATLMSKAAALYRQKHIAEVESESDARLAALHKFNGSKGAFILLRPPTLCTDQLAPHTPPPRVDFAWFRLVGFRCI